jgi:uncharacterized protein YgiM (DUF1202 family)
MQKQEGPNMRKPISRRQAAFSLAAALVLLLAAALPALAQDTLPATVYTTRNVFLRAGPGVGWRILAEMPGEEALTVLSQSNVWFQVRRANGTEGWVSGSYVSINPPGAGGGAGVWSGPVFAVPPAPGDIAFVTASRLNVRAGPGVNFVVIARASNGDFVTVLEKHGAWRRVQFAGGLVGWVNGQFLSGRIDTLENLTGGGEPPPASLPVTTVVTPPNPTPLEVNIVTTPRLNVRSGPGLLYSVVSVLSRDEFVTVLARDGGWRYIQTPSGARGWSNIEGLTRCDCALP